jgi:hypothetical protein
MDAGARHWVAAVEWSRKPWVFGVARRYRTRSCPVGAGPTALFLLGREEWQRLQIAERAQNHDGSCVLVFGGGFDLVAR